MHRNRRGCAVRIRRLLERIRPPEAAVALDLDVLFRPGLARPGGAARALGGDLPVGGVYFGAGLEDGVGCLGVGLGGYVAAAGGC